MARYLKLLALFTLICSLTGCSNTFNPVDHMDLILCTTTKEEYLLNRDLILAHTSETFQTQIDTYLSQPKTDTKAKTRLENLYVEQASDTVKIIKEYTELSAIGDTLNFAYFEYEDNLLVSYSIYTVEYPG